MPAKEKEHLIAINKELKSLTNEFANNVAKDKDAFELIIDDENRLAGLPDSAIALAKASAESKKVSGWRLTLQAPCYMAVMRYMDNAQIREKLYRAYNSIAAKGDNDNTKLLARIIALRNEKAKMLGFNNIADLILEDRMAKNEKTAKEFLKGLKEKVQAQFDREKIELYEFRKKIEGNGAPQLKPWDIAYYEEKQRKALYDFDSEVLRPYFSYEKVLKGMFDIAEQLFGIKLEKLRGYSVWDNLVETYGAFDADGTLIGSFYTDFFPRENKRGGAWMDCFISGLRKEDGFIPHHGIIAGNFTPAIGEKPSLLTHDEVCTTFHEFGHWLHQCLSKVDIRSLAGTNVSWDFVEFPSQIMENWCWEREALDMFARHYQNDSPIPPDLYDKMVRARNFRSGTYFMRQLGLGMLDLALHTEYDPSVHGDIIGYSRKILQEYLPAKLEDDYSMLSSFTHLFDDPIGYAAGYYSYKWSEALDADAFSRFQEEGILNSNTGKAFRETVLSKGNSEDPKILFESFMGRELNSNALLKRSGINP